MPKTLCSRPHGRLPWALLLAVLNLPWPAQAAQWLNEGSDTTPSLSGELHAALQATDLLGSQHYPYLIAFQPEGPGCVDPRAEALRLFTIDRLPATQARPLLDSPSWGASVHPLDAPRRQAWTPPVQTLIFVPRQRGDLTVVDLNRTVPLRRVPYPADGIVDEVAPTWPWSPRMEVLSPDGVWSEVPRWRSPFALAPDSLILIRPAQSSSCTERGPAR